MAIKIVAILLGFISAVMVYPWYDQYVLAVIALIGAIATGIVVYVVLVKLLNEVVD